MVTQSVLLQTAGVGLAPAGGMTTLETGVGLGVLADEVVGRIVVGSAAVWAEAPLVANVHGTPPLSYFWSPILIWK